MSDAMAQYGSSVNWRRLRNWIGGGMALAMMLATPGVRGADDPSQLGWNITTAKPGADNAEFVRIKRVHISQWSFPGQIVVRLPDGIKRRLPTADILAVQLTHAVVVPAVSAWQLVLRDRDVLPGYPMGTRHENIIFHAAGLGIVHIPLSEVAGLRRSAGVAIPDSMADHDSLYFNNDSHLAGAVVSIGSHRLVFQSNLGNTTIPLTRVNYIILGGAAPLPKAPAMAAVIEFINGATLRTPKFQWSEGKLSLVDPAGKTLAVSIDQIARVDIVGGTAVWLTDLAPLSIKQASWIGDNRRFRDNRCVTGQPLRVDGHVFSHGLGVHVDCTLTYKIGGAYKYFMVRPAMDDSAGSYGRTNVFILADGKVVYSGHHLHAGMTNAVVRLPMAGVQTLSLRAVDAGRYGVRGRVDWLDAVLIRK